MGGFFGAASKRDIVLDTFFGVDYHTHLGTHIAGLLFYDEEKGFQRHIHNIENAPFRSRFEDDLKESCGKIGIGCISDANPQPLLVKSHLGTYGISTTGFINNKEELIKNGEKIPEQIKIYKEKGKKIIKEWDDDNKKLIVELMIV